ncbi:hypothetical protein [Bacillus cereus group sp. BfR-BA-01309]|uniref:hypothetical protein n=1 Tax=Bacillus cereus group sp. BfR-BA-01309 TaxID=2920286 RepID=UPI0035C8C4E1
MGKMKCVDGITLEQIAEDINYSSGYPYKKHAQIIIIRIKFIEELAPYCHTVL